jgi:hypothetical protein
VLGTVPVPSLERLQRILSSKQRRSLSSTSKSCGANVTRNSEATRQQWTSGCEGG